MSHFFQCGVGVAFNAVISVLLVGGLMYSIHLASVSYQRSGRIQFRSTLEEVSRCYQDGSIVKPISLVNTSFFEVPTGKTSAGKEFKERVDVLQVVAVVDSVVEANVRQVVHLSHSPAFVHVVVTPDVQACYTMRRKFSHVRCFHDNEVFNQTITLRDINKSINSVGPVARKKGGAWYFQQMLKLGAVALGIGGLGEYVRVMDGEVVQIRDMQWYTENGGEVFETCASEINEAQIIAGNGPVEEPYNDYNDIHYGALWTRLTHMPLAHDHSLIAHLMSMRQSRVRSLLTKLSPNDEGWETNNWVTNILIHICDPVAELGFSEYWYYASYILLDEEMRSQAQPLIRSEAYHCSRPKRDDVTAAIAGAQLACHLMRIFPRSSYGVLENHKSREK